ncbi:hypothetical protein [Hymenobacter properus]|uniref:PepSY domain-containing protein n=1 Tax=Hymenobacter properus TaxID=2791026 RepID=A0A931BB29_9BACT|nr:hypothetical protein [Hymenobacter properus]MBF9140484.1 hypothetical protein [Hymenobacter properus]MBR7719291.1 hypothetical protein [Microvirga sp. SRT04]
MPTLLSYLSLGAALVLAGCQQSPPANTATQTPAQASAETAQPDAPKTEAQARTLTADYVKTLPNAALYVVDSARVNDNGPTWQVLVPRRDWAKRMPNSARFEVNKTTGEVSTGAVK